jgi:hypothetical protein
MTAPDDDAPRTAPAPKRRARGWLLSLAAVATWEAVWLVVMTVATGTLPSGDALYWYISPLLLIIVVFATPLTYLVAWRRERPYPVMLVWSLPVVVVVFALSSRSVY